MNISKKSNQPRVLGVILARGGSKGVPKKNVRPLRGIPLIAYTICEARRSKYITRLIVSTEDEGIASIAKNYGAEAPFLRPVYLAEDTASSHSAVEHAVEWVEKEEGEKYDFIVEMLTTNPLKTFEDIDNVIEKLIATRADSVIAVTKLEDHHPIRIKKIVDDKIVDFCFKEEYGSRRQDFKPEAYIRNGSVYSCRRDCLHKRVGSQNSRPYIMPNERSVNIDTMNDFILAECMIENSPREYICPVKNLETKTKEKNEYKTKQMPEGKERRLLITSVPFGDYEDSPLEILKERGVDFTLNPWGRPPTEEELIKVIADYGMLLAGSSPVTERVMDNAAHLKLIARAGVGFDSVDTDAAEVRKISVTYTPEAPVAAVAEFTIGLMLSLLRHIHKADIDIKEGRWIRRPGRRLGTQTVGLVGFGRIGKAVASILDGFGTRVLVADIKKDESFGVSSHVEWAPLKTILREADIVSLHLPLNSDTKNLFSKEEFTQMKPIAIIVNTSRGGIIDEEALVEALRAKKIAGAALDVYTAEPYSGPLAKMDNCLLSAHMASAAIDCKRAMEMGAVREVFRFLEGKPALVPVPKHQ